MVNRASGTKPAGPAKPPAMPLAATRGQAGAGACDRQIEAQDGDVVGALQGRLRDRGQDRVVRCDAERVQHAGAGAAEQVRGAHDEAVAPVQIGQRRREFAPRGIIQRRCHLCCCRAHSPCTPLSTGPTLCAARRWRSMTVG
ncbi:MAG: hypothetical protein WDN04_06825 [Rhodospirillales bacterium]